MGEKIKASHQIERSRLFKITAEKIDFGNGHEATWEIINFNGSGRGSVFILALDKEDVILERHYLLGPRQDLLTLPMGGIEENETPEEAAYRELKEETGYLANKIVLLPIFYPLPGYIRLASQLCLATNLTPGEPKGGDEVEPFEIVRLPFKEALALVRAGEIKEARTVIGLLYYSQFGTS